MMASKERVLRQVRGDEVDRPPLMGGWMHGPDKLAVLSGVSLDTYLADPATHVVRANRALHVDCLPTHILVPDRADMIRSGHSVDADHVENEPEDVKRDGEAVPDSEREIVTSLDMAEIEGRLREDLEKRIPLVDTEVLIPTCWLSVPNFQHMFGRYGYASTFMAIGLYPEAVGRLYWQSAVEARVRNTILIKLIRELDLPPALLTGHDICNNAGPMCSMDFLREYYFPQERMALEPLLDAGIRVVRHCDGNVMPLIEDSLAVGYSGFQGFQYECGVDPFAFAKRKDVKGDRLLFFAGMSVTRTLPMGTVDDVRDEIDYVMDYTDGGKGLFFFCSNVIGAEVPLERVKFAYDYASKLKCGSPPTTTTPRKWPWLLREESEEE